jgi:heme/copper-type cytochrome/quinol oxidase subunit 4
METAAVGEKRELGKTAKKGLQIRDVLLIGILLAAGAVLRTAVGTVINFGMKPNFIIAMYCLTILLIKPGFVEAAIIGVLAGAICQFFPGQPYINFVSELLGAIAMCLLTRIPLGKGLEGAAGKAVQAARIIGCTFLSTLVSGFSFIGVMYFMYYSGADIKPTPLAIFLAIIFGTAAINAVIVQILYIPLKLALKRNDD